MRKIKYNENILHLKNVFYSRRMDLYLIQM